MKNFIFIFFIILITTSIKAQTDKVEYVPGSTKKISQLVGDYDRQQQSQTLNVTESRYGLISTDLGVPFHHRGRTYLLFGDSWGATVGDAIAYTTDTNPEDGIDLTFTTYDDGTYKPVIIPGISQGDFEVPMEGVSVGSKMYIYHTTDHSSTIVMGRSVLAVSEDDGDTFSYLYDFSKRHFINVSVVDVDLTEWPGFPLDTGNGLVIFGSGSYRQSNVRLAYQPADQIEIPQSLRYFTGLDQNNIPLWSENEDDAIPLFSQPFVGELSVSYNPFLRKWLMLYNCDPPRGINFRSADVPWGPWSEPQVLFDPWEDNGYCHFMHVNWQFSQCDSVHDPDRQYEWGGEYGPYQFEDLATGDDSTTTLYFTLSTWNPYTVVLMKSTLRLLRAPTFVNNENSTLPIAFLLEQNYPNPFNSATKIAFELPTSSEVVINIFNSAGQQVAELVNGRKPAGYHSVTWNSSDYSSGIYFIRMMADAFIQTRKCVFLK